MGSDEVCHPAQTDDKLLHEGIQGKHIHPLTTIHLGYPEGVQARFVRLSDEIQGGYSLSSMTFLSTPTWGGGGAGTKDLVIELPHPTVWPHENPALIPVPGETMLCLKTVQGYL